MIRVLNPGHKRTRLYLFDCPECQTYFSGQDEDIKDAYAGMGMAPRYSCECPMCGKDVWTDKTTWVLDREA
jgi:endogenous inhibitor of DNA gyrase (YacG/DUF329 family)